MIQNITSKDQQKVSKLIDDIDIYRKTLLKIDYINNQEEFFATMHTFWQFLGTISDERLCQLFLHSSYFEEHGSYFRSLEHYYTRAVEVAEAFTIITKQLERKLSFLDLFSTHVTKETYLQTNREMKMLDFKKCKKMVMVGCGCLPETMLYIYENTPIKEIIGIDNNQEAIYIAGEIVRNLGASKLHLLHENSINYDYKDADIILISNMMDDKKKILDRIAETTSDKVQILARTPIHLGHMFYESATEDLHNRLAAIKSERVSEYFLEHTVLMKKLEL